MDRFWKNCGRCYQKKLILREFGWRRVVERDRTRSDSDGIRTLKLSLGAVNTSHGLVVSYANAGEMNLVKRHLG